MNKRSEIQRLVEQYYQVAFKPDDFVPGKTPVRYAGRVFNEAELVSAVNAVLDFWLTAGRFTDEFEKGLADYLDVEHVMLVIVGYPKLKHVVNNSSYHRHQ